MTKTATKMKNDAEHDAYAAEDEDALDQFDCSMDAANECALRGTPYCDDECPFSGELK